MEGTSSFIQIEASPPRGWRALGRSSFGALEGAAASVPLSLGCATLVFSRVGADAVASGVFATMLALVIVHLASANSARPVCFSARIFEGTTLAAMIDQLAPQLAGWGLPDTGGVRLAFLCAICAGAGLCVALLYLLRAERLTPFIPGPVFAGFSNSIALVLLVAQWRSFWQLATSPAAALSIVSILAAALVTAFAVRRWLPGRPAAAAGLAAGLLAGWAWTAQGQPPALVGGAGWMLPLPVFLADFGALARPGVQLAPVALLVVGNAAILGTMVFINTALAAQALSQFDRLQGARPRDGVATGLSMAIAGMAGSAPVSGSILTCLSVVRTAPLRRATMVLMAGAVAAIWLTGVLGHMPLAAVLGVLLCEAWFLVDRPSLRLAADWLRRRPLPANAREDLALVAAVTALAVITNMVVAALGGLVLGLFLVAVRSARKPVRHVWDGRQISSNCARASAELRVLADHAAELRVFELEGDMFFAVGASLDRSLTAGTEGASCIVLDWSRVRNMDSSVAALVASFERQAGARGIFVVHAGAASGEAGNVAGELRRRMPGARLERDLDYALELAENHLIMQHGHTASGEASSMLNAVQLFDGFTPEERTALDWAMCHKLFRAGDVILRAGEPSDEMMLILEGSASVIVANAEGQPVRLAGVRRGSVIGEVGFLDRAARSATVVAQTDVVVAILDRQQFDRLCGNGHPAVAKLLGNLAVALSRRLRHTSQLALARSRTN